MLVFSTLQVGVPVIKRYFVSFLFAGQRDGGCIQCGSGFTYVILDFFFLAHRKYNLNRSSLRGSTIMHWGGQQPRFFSCWKCFAGDCRGTNPQGDILGYGLQ